MLHHFDIELNDEEQEEYSLTIERGLKQSRVWIAVTFCISVIGYLGFITPLLLDSDAHIVSVVGLCLTICAMLLCFVLCVELVMGCSLLSRTPLFSTQLHFINAVVIISVFGGCLQFSGRIANGPCDVDQSEFSCNPLHEEGVYPVGPLNVVASFVVFAQLVGQVNSWRVILVCWASVTATFLYSSSMYDFRGSVSPFLGLLFMITSSVKHCFYSKRNFLFSRQCAKADRDALELEHKAQVMESRVSDMRHIVGNVSHDLKTPIQAFSVEVDSLKCSLRYMEQEFDAMPSPSKQHLADCHSSIRTLEDITSFMLSTINRCLDYTKASTGLALAASNSTFNLREALEWAINCIKRSKEKNNISLLPISPEICDYIITDHQWLVENMLCLLSNAVKFTMDGSVEVRCLLHTAKELLFEVEDSGVGISEDKRSSLFKPFQQAQRSAGGTGLGLYSLSKRIECMKGQCGVKSRQDGQQGCCFWFTIPYIPDHTIEKSEESTRSYRRRPRSATVHPSPRQPSGESDIDTRNKPSRERNPQQVSVLLVEDAIVIQKTIVGALRRRNFDVSVASNGLIGLNMLKEEEFDVVLMDLHMPMLDGHECTKRFREFERGQRPKTSRQIIVGISANFDDATIALCTKSGMDSFLAKPFSIENLNKVCRSLNVRGFVQ